MISIENKMSVIINIQTMQRIIGVSVSNTNWLMQKTYEQLHEEQNSLIEHYNQAIKNGNA